MAADLGAAVRQCPFLALVSAREGEAFARSLAANPFAPASLAGPVLLEEAGEGYAAALRLFHGPGGVVPLRRFDGAAPAHAAAGCPFRAAATQQGTAEAASSEPATPATPVPAPACAAAARAPSGTTQPLGRAPFASISISGFGFVPDLGQLFNRPARPKQQQQQQQRKPAEPGNSRTGAGSAGGGSGGGRPGAASTSSPSVASHGTAGASGSARPRPAGGPPTRSGGAGGWGQVLGGLIPLAANGQLSCPAPIVKMRAAVAALKPVRELRPRALPVRALAMGATAVAANLPCGAWREHTEKFSPQWFAAVHATIPFVAMLRKAVLMPKWAILLTLAGAIAGQGVGSRLERKRLRRLASLRQAGPADPSHLSLNASCRQCVKAAQAAIAWTLAPTVVL